MPDGRSVHVLVVGRGAPERGGIPTFLDMVASTDFPGPVTVSMLNLGSSTVRSGGQASTGNLLRTITDASRVWRAARTVDVVHLNTAFAPTVTALRAAVLVLAARLAGCRVAMHVHGGRVALWMTTRSKRLLGAACLLGAHRVLAVSHAVHTVLCLALPHRGVDLLDNGVETDRFSGPPLPEGRRRILFVGGLTPRKGVVDLLHASRRLDDAGVDHELWIVGGTPDEGAAAEAEVRRTAGPSARFLGTRAAVEMPEVYRGAGVFCLPSWYEAMPLSVLEAMATGLPVVATTVGDVPRLVDDGQSGLLVPPGDPVQLSAALESVLSSPDRAASMGAEGRRRVEEHFSMPRLVRDLQNVYLEAMKERR